LSADEIRQHTGLTGKATSLLIEHYETIFTDVQITKDDFCNSEDLELLMAPKLNMVNVNHLIARHQLRKGSRIPWVPSVKAEKNPKFEKPTIKPNEEGESSSSGLLTPTRMGAAWESMRMMARPSVSELPPAAMFAPSLIAGDEYAELSHLAEEVGDGESEGRPVGDTAEETG
jgi:hypothetical protein